MLRLAAIYGRVVAMEAAGNDDLVVVGRCKKCKSRSAVPSLQAVSCSCTAPTRCAPQKFSFEELVAACIVKIRAKTFNAQSDEDTAMVVWDQMCMNSVRNANKHLYLYTKAWMPVMARP